VWGKSLVDVLLPHQRILSLLSLEKAGGMGRMDKRRAPFGCPPPPGRLHHKHPFIIVEEESPRVPRRGWAEMIRKVFEVDPLLCPQCGGQMRMISVITDYAVVDRIINHLKLTFVAERPPPPHLVSQEFLMDSEASADYFS
jgi:hypothetical protein